MNIDLVMKCQLKLLITLLELSKRIRIYILKIIASGRQTLKKKAKSSLIIFTSSATSCLVHLGYYGLILVRSYENIYSNNHGITTLSNHKASNLTFPLYLYHEKSNIFFGVDIGNIYWCHT